MKIEITTERTVEGLWLATASRVTSLFDNHPNRRELQRALASNVVEQEAIHCAIRLLFSVGAQS